MVRLIDADILEKEGWSLHRTYQKDKAAMVYEVKAISEINTAQSDVPDTNVGKWIPCSERLPEYTTQVLVQLTHTGDIFVGALAPNVEGACTMWDLPNFSSYICLEDVIAWMPLPEPWEGEKNE